MSTATDIKTASTADPARTSAPTERVTVKSAQPGIRNRTVLLYLVLAVIVLVPGLALRAGLEATGNPVDSLGLGRLGLGRLGLGRLGELSTYLTAMQLELQDIQFGRGLRFWLGVGGTTMLASLLLYPIRKMLANRRGVGSVGGWFHLHILLGIIGPVLILYHGNFRHGKLDANVALWTMLLVAVSGVIGFFVYGRISATFYNSRQQAQMHRNAVLASILDTAQFQARKDQLLAKLEAFEAELLTPRQGFTASIMARLRLERRRREITDDVAGLMVDTARARGVGPVAFQQFRAVVSRHVRAYFGIARAAASQSILEQLWARWRMLHMPVFLIMLVATILHVVAVWDLGEPTLADAHQAGIEVAADATTTRRPAVKNEAGTIVASARIAEAPAQGVPRATLPTGMSQRVVPTINTLGVADAGPTLAPADAVPMVAVPKPQPARRPVPAKQIQTAAVADVQANEIKATEPKSAELLSSPAVEPRRIDAPPMALGASTGVVKPASLDAMFAAFKMKQQAGEFSHSDLETGFALTGKHLKTDCAACHTAPLPVTRQTTAARTCVNCHAKDDNHNGSRPNCAKCHTTNRFKQRIR